MRALPSVASAPPAEEWGEAGKASLLRVLLARVCAAAQTVRLPSPSSSSSVGGALPAADALRFAAEDARGVTLRGGGAEGARAAEGALRLAVAWNGGAE
ncbi:hypothetical protein T492DRAFT_879359, partial [Pavlovales sp. CCMP2436]